ncbi:hypothetical protein M9H77_27837 [Catharanthus roseus]|uniref:Uncharacterized protein n=1 Tax=Catharanthus roseus TaxID=4058 RepID=A0ACC0AEI5_CATRO|nr:hypothetical protein M9H77_27837 [Catharanthus roseus]
MRKKNPKGSSPFGSYDNYNEKELPPFPVQRENSTHEPVIDKDGDAQDDTTKTPIKYDYCKSKAIVLQDHARCERESSNDIPMDIVEFMAKIKFERAFLLKKRTEKGDLKGKRNNISSRFN